MRKFNTLLSTIFFFFSFMVWSQNKRLDDDTLRKRLQIAMTELDRRGVSNESFDVNGGPTDQVTLEREVWYLIIMNRVMYGDLLKTKDYDHVLAIKVTPTRNQLIGKKRGQEVTAINKKGDGTKPFGEILINVDRYAKTPLNLRIALVWHEYLGLSGRDRDYEHSSQDQTKGGGPIGPTSPYNNNYWVLFGEFIRGTHGRFEKCLMGTFWALVQSIRQDKIAVLSEKEVLSYLDKLMKEVPQELRVSNGYQFEVSTRFYKKYESPEELFRDVEAYLTPRPKSPVITVSRAVALIHKHFVIEKNNNPYCGWIVERKK